MHFRTHVKEEHTGISGPSGDEYHDGMVEHDMHVGQLLDLLDDSNIADNTVVMYSTDNGPHLQHLAGCRNHAVPQREELELGGRLPRAGLRALARPFSGRQDAERHRCTRRLAADLRGRRRGADIKEKLRDGVELNGADRTATTSTATTAPLPDRRNRPIPAHEFWYVNDDGQIVAARYDDWKVVFLENRGQAFGVWREPFIELRVPLVFNLRRDPFEKAQHNANIYDDWLLDRAFVIVPVQALAAQFLTTMQEYPPSQTPGSFNLSAIEKRLSEGLGR
jgi:hypothetical protein